MQSSVKRASLESNVKKLGIKNSFRSPFQEVLYRQDPRLFGEELYAIEYLYIRRKLNQPYCNRSSISKNVGFYYGDSGYRDGDSLKIDLLVKWLHHYGYIDIEGCFYSISDEAYDKLKNNEILLVLSAEEPHRRRKWFEAYQEG